MAEVLDDLIASAYRSLTGPDGHAVFMRALARTFHSHLLSVQLDSNDHRHVTKGDFDAEGRALDEMTRIAAACPVQSPWFASDAARRLPQLGMLSDEDTGIPYSELAMTDFHEIILKPFDIAHSFVMYINTDHTGATAIGISRSRRIGAFSPDEMQMARRVLPHIRNVHAIQKTLATHSRSDEANYAAWTLTCDGRICGRNHRAADFLSHAGPAIAERNGRLWPIHVQDRAALHAEIGEVLSGKRLGAKVPVRDKTGAPRYLAHVRQCRREAFLTWLLTDLPAALVILQPLAGDPSTLEPVLTRLYGLTPAECRVAVSLLELESIGQVAASLARSEETIRSQVKAIFTKTGTHSQAQLVKLLYALSQS